MIPEERPDYDDYSSDEEEIPEYINEENRRLKIMAKKQKKDLKNLHKECQQLEERHKIISQHAKNVEQEKLHLQGLVDTKQKEIETENHMKQIIERQIGRLESQMRKLEKQEVEFRERLNDSQFRVHQVSQKCEQLKLQLNWNQEELEQWVMVTKQKQEDHVDLQRFKKQDDIKIRELSLQIQKLTVQVSRKQVQLEKEITETQTSQIQLDKTAQEFKKLHDERHKLFQKWQQVTKSISRRNNDIQKLAMQTADLKAQISNQNQLIDVQKTRLLGAIKQNKQSQMKAEFLMRDISERKNENKKIEFETNSNLQAQVEILKNKLSSDATELVSKRNKIALLQQQLLTKKQRLNNQQQKYASHQIKLKNELKLAEKFTGSKNDAEARLKQNQLEKKGVQHKIALQKDVLVKASGELFKLKDNQVTLYGQIQGNIAACRNLQSHINKLNQQFQKQQELLYNAEYQIQLMERKVARAKGQRTLEQKKDLQKQIDQVTKKNTEIRAQHKILNQSVKKLDEDLRGVQNSLTSTKQTQKHLTSVIEQLTLQNEMTAQDLNKICKNKQEVLVQHDIMKLQIKKIKGTLNKATDNVFSLENKKNQLQMSMQEREKQIQVHKDILLAEFKAAEDQRHKIAIELASRTNRVKNLKIKYEALVQKNHGGSNQSVAQHSQAYYVIKAAQQRQQLQRKGDELSAKIIKAQKQLKSLQCTLVDMKATNIKIKQKGLRKGLAKEDLQQKASIEEQLNSASDTLHNMKQQVGQNERQYQEDLRRYTEVRNKIQNIDGRKKGLDQQAREVSRQLEQVLDQQTKAKRSLNTVKNDPRLKKQVTNLDAAEVAQLQYDIQKQKNKALFSSLISLTNQIPQLAAILEDALKNRDIQLPNQAPSSIDMMSSKAMSVRSGHSQQSHQSQQSQYSRQSRQSQNSKQSAMRQSQQSQQSQISRGSGMSGLSGSAIGRVTGISRNPR